MRIYRFNDWNKAYSEDEVGWANRSPEDMANVVALWMGAGGSHHNYYMWYGGNHISHWGGSSLANWYADGVNYHSDGLPNEPKRTHLQTLHNVLGSHQKPLLEDDIQVGNEIPLTPVNHPPPTASTTSTTWAYLYTVRTLIFCFLLPRPRANYCKKHTQI